MRSGAGIAPSAGGQREDIYLYTYVYICICRYRAWGGGGFKAGLELFWCKEKKGGGMLGLGREQPCSGLRRGDGGGGGWSSAAAHVGDAALVFGEGGGGAVR